LVSSAPITLGGAQSWYLWILPDLGYDPDQDRLGKIGDAGESLRNKCCTFGASDDVESLFQGGASTTPKPRNAKERANRVK
jgi:hypothetical protein